MVTQYWMNRWMDKHLRPRMPQPAGLFALQVLQDGPADVLSRGCCAWNCYPRIVSGTLHVILSAKEPGQGPPPVTWVPQFPVRILRPEIKAQAATLPRLFAMATSGSHSWAGCCNCSGPGFYHLLALPLLHDYVLPGQHKEKNTAAELPRNVHLSQAGLAWLSSQTVGPRQLSLCHTEPTKQTAAGGPVLPWLGDLTASPALLPVCFLTSREGIEQDRLSVTRKSSNLHGYIYIIVITTL